VTSDGAAKAAAMHIANTIANFILQIWSWLFPSWLREVQKLTDALFYAAFSIYTWPAQNQLGKFSAERVLRTAVLRAVCIIYDFAFERAITI
jgi:hypothetical protein